MLMATALHLDDHARGIVMTVLAGIPGLLADLDVTLTRAHRFVVGTPVGRTRPGSRLPYHVAASDAIDRLEVVLKVFTAKIGVGRSDAPADPGEQARWLHRILPGIPGDHPALEGIELAVTAAVADAFAIVDRPVDHIYLGLCVECGRALYTAPEHRRAVCACGVEVEVAQRRDSMLEQARYRFGTASELARLLPWFAGMPITAAAVTKAGERGKIPRITAGGRVLYRVGDVVDWHTARHTYEDIGDG
jgi:hypothetical protein